MTAGTDALKRAFRLFRTEGIPATGPHEPDKPEIQAALDSLAIDIIAAGASGAPDAVRAVSSLSATKYLKLGTRLQRSQPRLKQI